MDLKLVQLLAKAGTIRKYAENEAVFIKGQNAENVFVILSGKVEGKITSGGNEVTVLDLETGGFFGENAILGLAAQDITVTATLETLIISIRKTDFENILKEYPEISFDIMQNLISRVKFLNDVVSEFIHNPSFKALPKVAKTKPRETKPDKTIGAGAAAGADTGFDLEQRSPAGAVSAATPSAPVKTVENVPAQPAQSARKEKNIGNLSIDIPEKHKKYSISSPKEYENYLYETEAKCPVCGNKFKYQRQASSQLKLSEAHFDGRRVYKNFEPLWYAVVVCPNCNYASFVNDFKKISKTEIEEIKSKASDIKVDMSDFYLSPRSIDDVFLSYYLTLFYAQFSASRLKITAKGWQSLFWLYSDAKDSEMADYAADKVIFCYSKLFFESDFLVTPELEQSCCILLSEMYRYKNDYENALKMLYEALKSRTNRDSQIRDRIKELRSSHIQ